MAKHYYAVGYSNEDIMNAVTADGWTITPSDKLFGDKPLCYYLRATPDAATYVTYFPGEAGPPMLDMSDASEDDCDLIDQFDAIGENDYFASLDLTTTVTVRLTNIIYDTIDADGEDQRDTIDPEDLPTTAVVTIEIDDCHADDEEEIGIRAADELEGDWLITGYDVEILENEDA